MVWNDCLAKSLAGYFPKDIPVLSVCIMEYSMLPLTQHDHFCLQGIRRSNQKYNIKLLRLSFLSLKISFFYYKLTEVSEKLVASAPGGATRRAEHFFLQQQRRSCTKWLVYLFKPRRETHPPVIH